MKYTYNIPDVEDIYLWLFCIWKEFLKAPLPKLNFFKGAFRPQKWLTRKNNNSGF